MQEIKKRRIVIASVLKPVDDTRMLEKFAASLSPLADVHVIGMATTGVSPPVSVSCHPHGPFARLSVARLRTSWRVAKTVLQLKPDVFIVTTHELLAVAAVAKLFTSCRVVYDVQENYYRNIVYTDAFVPGLRRLVAAWVRLKEWLFAPIVDHFVLAEKAFEQELAFGQDRRTVVENKVRLPAEYMVPRSAPKEDTFRLLFSGTLAESTGVFTALALVRALHAADPRLSLTLMGHCAQPEVLQRIRHELSSMPYVVLKGGDRLVPHAHILQAIAGADAGIVCYEPNPATENRIPTKVYEYVGFRLPVLLAGRQPGQALCEEAGAALWFDPASVDATAIWTALRRREFYRDPLPDVYWESEEPKLLHVVKALL